MRSNRSLRLLGQPKAALLSAPVRGVKASMNSRNEISNKVRAELLSIYEEVMWLSERPNVTPSSARAWYTHIAYKRVSGHIRFFTGKVSEKAVVNLSEPLQLEHFRRIQTTLTKLVEEHIEGKIRNPEIFINTIFECEQVNVVSRSENYEARKAKGDYEKAKIKLIEWDDVPKERRATIWQKTLKGRVENANQYRVQP